MPLFSIEDPVEGFTVKVGDDGHMRVAALPPVTVVDQLSPVAGNGTSSEVVPAQPGRTSMTIQNQGAVPVHISLSDASRPANPLDHLIAPGATFATAAGTRYEGAVQAMAVGATAQLAVIQYIES